MTSTRKSQITIDSQSRSLSAMHNCPNCRCRTPTSTSHLPQLRLSRIQHNINGVDSPPKSVYLSQNVENLGGLGRERGNIYRSQFLGGSSRGIDSPVETTQKANITFSYSSPSKKKYHSSQARFTTKNFKQKHFPNLDQRQEDSMQKIVIKNKKSSFDYQIYTEKQAPKQPKILKMNKIKSKQKLEITLSHNQSNPSVKSVKKSSLKLSNVPYNEYGLDTPKPTPISALWQNQFNDEIKMQHMSQSQLFQPEVRIPSIDNIRYSRVNQTQLSEKPQLSHSQQISRFESKGIIAESKVVLVEDRKSSIRSVEMHSNPKMEIQLISEILPERINIFRDRSLKQSQQLDIKDIDKEMELARSISEELQLNFDYYYPQPDSDKSMSVNLSI